MDRSSYLSIMRIAPSSSITLLWLGLRAVESGKVFSGMQQMMEVQVQTKAITEWLWIWHC